MFVHGEVTASVAPACYIGLAMPCLRVPPGSHGAGLARPLPLLWDITIHGRRSSDELVKPLWGYPKLGWWPLRVPNVMA